MNIIDHPDIFKTGVRLLYLNSRNKDTTDTKRKILKISYSIDEFDDVFNYLQDHAGENYRIYVSANSRNIDKAIRLFRERQLQAELDTTNSFYKNIESRWNSCLGSPLVQDDKLWLFDCDNEEEYNKTIKELQIYYDRDLDLHNGSNLYEYETKNGKHIITAPFNTTKLSNDAKSLIHKNPLMLFAY